MEDIKRNYDIKWQKDLALFMPIYNSIVLEGFINDLYPVKKQGEIYGSYEGLEYEDEAAYSYYDLPYTIAELYKKDYCIVFFDHTKKQGKTVGGRAPQGARPEPQGPTTVEYGTFEIYEREANADNVALFDRLYTKEYVDQVEGTESNQIQNPLSRDMIRIRDAISMYEEAVLQNDGKSYKPFLFILKSVSRFMVEPGRTSEREYPAFNVLFEISQIRDVRSKLVMVVDKMNDLPTWLESENNNYLLKKLYISSPDSDFKTKYFLNELTELFLPDYSILRVPYYAVDGISLAADWEKRAGTLDGDMRKFNAFTEGFTVQTLQLFKRFLENEPNERTEIRDISVAVQRFKLGNQTDPWKSESLRTKILDKGKGGLLETMKSNILGQDQVLVKVHEGLKYAITGINRIKDNDRRPRAVFFLAGPTGTGKTEIAKLLARELFGSEDRMIRFDMSEFSAEHTDSRLFGAPPGYVGYEAGGELTQAVKQNPFSIILFDEIEKANGKILDKFLQILGDGRLTDGKGETVYFSDSIIIFTSNCGITAMYEASDKVAATKLLEIEKHESAGDIEKLFAAKADWALYSGIKAESMSDKVFNRSGSFDDKLFYEYIKISVKLGVKTYFEQRLGRPELLGRIGEDNIVVYNFMTSKSAPFVAGKTIKDFTAFLRREHGITMQTSEEVTKHIIERVCRYEVLNLGARGIVMTTENMLKTPIAEYLSREDRPEGGSVTLQMAEDGSIVCR